MKRLVKAVALIPGCLMPHRGPCARILTYHSVGVREHEMNVTPEDFRDQMAWLASHVPAITLEQAAQGAPGVAVSFDDGYRDTLAEAAPILDKHSIPAAVFVVAGRVGATLDHDTDASASELLNWDEIRQLEAMGWHIGAHSATHRRLAELDEEAQREEIFASKRLLEDALGHAVAAFAYPFGSALDYDDTSIRLVREAGFTYAFSNRYGVHYPGADPWAIRRIWVDRSDDLGSFAAKVSGALDVLAVLDSPVGIRARCAFNRFLGQR